MWLLLRFSADSQAQAQSAAATADGGGTLLGVALSAPTRAVSIGDQVITLHPAAQATEGHALARAAASRHVETHLASSLSDLDSVTGWLGAAVAIAGLVG